ncbi:hypothetical protein [Cerasicoccus maritimus]|uniref:hypothetical protein n=1 Tax=Cerasicoccus maritimus TaxID=490089 RepID=UPI0028529A51|nr:hypothetical protein [Cerasicoccus maritimus]
MHSRFVTMMLFPLALASVARAESNAQPYFAGMSPDAEMVLIADVESLLASPLIQQIQAMVQSMSPSENPNALPMGLTEFTGATNQDLGKIVVSTRDVMLLQEIDDPSTVSKEQIEQTGVMLAFQINKGIGADSFQQWVESVTPPEELAKTSKSEVGKGLLYNSEGQTGMAMGFLPSDAQTMIFVGSEPSVKTALTTGSGKLPAKVATAETLSATLPNLAVLAAPSAAWKQQLVSSADEKFTSAEDAEFIKQAEQFLFGFNITDGLTILSGIKFANDAIANKAYTAMDESITEFKATPIEPGPMSLLAPLINKMQVTEDGDAVTFSTGMNAGESQQMLMMLPMLVMSQMSQGMGPGGPGMGAPAGE